MKAPLKIALIYLACGLSWIVLSDRFLFYILNYNGEDLNRTQTFKGVFYIVVTAVLLYYIVDCFYKKLSDKLTKLEATNAAIEAQNKQLQEIAHMQSHVVRAPLATMMGFVHLLEDCSVADDEKQQIHKNILHSAKELDDVIKEISGKACATEM